MIKKILIVTIIALNVFSSQLEDIQTNFEEITKDVIAVVQNKAMATDDRNSKIVQIVTPMFDFKLMAKLSLGRQWKQMTKEQQNEFIELYVKRMKQSYSSKIDKYTNEKIIINNIKQVKKTRVTLNTSLVSSGDKLEVIYKFYKPRKQRINKNLWLAYDVVIQGVSVIKTDKAQFKAVLKESTISQLMERLRK